MKMNPVPREDGRAKESAKCVDILVKTCRTKENYVMAKQRERTLIVHKLICEEERIETAREPDDAELSDERLSALKKDRKTPTRRKGEHRQKRKSWRI